MGMSKIVRFSVALLLCSAAIAAEAKNAGKLAIGELAHDGPPTPEQLSLIIPITGELPQTTTATVRYKPAKDSKWTVGHPLYRIRPEFTEKPAVGTVPNAFAWPILG